MTGNCDISENLQAAVRAAIAERAPFCIVGGGTKQFYGRPGQGKPLDVSGNCGVVAYEPTELVITARGGTPLVKLETILAEKDQMLPFEPPHFGRQATLGGTIACGFSGPRRPYAGAARDFVLGVKCLTGKGEILTFGGQVMKNVAGYDVSRLMVGALGTLGILLEISIKVLPKPAHDITLALEQNDTGAITTMNAWGSRPLPISAACFDGVRLYARLSGTEQGVMATYQKLGGELVKDGYDFWQSIREHRHPFFNDDTPLWRLSVAPATPKLELPGRWLLDWGGAQRWLKSDAPAAAIRRAVEAVGGHATLFRGGDRRDVFHPLAAPLMALHRNLKTAFDPHGILNPKRMYDAW